MGQRKSQYHTTLALLATYIPLSDWADGYLARRHNMSTQLGSFLDPFADKFFMLTLSLTLCHSGAIDSALYPEVVGLWVFRDMFLLTMGFAVLGGDKSLHLLSGSGGARISASPLSKSNSVLQFLTVGLGTGLLAYYGGREGACFVMFFWFFV
ncbi:hypothetical protein TrRE_jg2522 [Triparma retinervis]|uniref:Uncharacterized protein n=1 Tax=Triparma retinervis TaxID=2557542 RepID=A0A9W7AGY9_9STRA|nr:hypothetical protein TrRE_jg2522 [Triparma retinervis]